MHNKMAKQKDGLIAFLFEILYIGGKASSLILKPGFYNGDMSYNLIWPFLLIDKAISLKNKNSVTSK